VGRCEDLTWEAAASRRGVRAHVMLCHNHYDLMAFTTPGESPLRYRQDNRKASHGHEDVAVMKERTPKPEHAVNLHAMLCGGNSEPNRRALRTSTAPRLTQLCNSLSELAQNRGIVRLSAS